MFILIICGWVFFGVLSVGWTFAYCQGKFPTIAEDNWREDLGFAVAFGFLGPIAAFLAFVGGGFAEHGWRLWRKKTNVKVSGQL